MAARSDRAVGRRARALAAGAIALVVAAAYPGLREASPFATLEGLTLDARFAVRGELSAGPDVVVLAIDDRSIAALGGWPLPRAWLARAAAALAEDGASAVVFDLLLLNPPADSAPENSLAALAGAFAEAGNVVLPYAFTFSEGGGAAHVAPPALQERAYRLVRETGDADSRALLRPVAVAVPPDALLEAADAGHAAVLVDSTRALRFDHVAMAYGERVYPSLAVVAAMHGLGLDRDDLVADLGHGVRFGEHRVETDGHMRLAVNHYGPAGRFPAHAFIDLVEGAIPVGTFRDRVVVIGATATGVGDTFASPYSARLPGVEYFATVVDNILTGRWLVRTDWVGALDLAVIVALGLGAALIARSERPLAIALGIAALIAALLVVHTLAFSLARIWLNLVFPLFALLAIALWSLAAAALAANRRGQDALRQRDQLARYVGPSVAARISGSPGGAGAAHTQFATVMFVDIAGFTGLSERMAPARAHALLREFQRLVERAADDHDGAIDKFIGDGALLVFGLDRPAPDDPARALACALSLAAAIRAWRPGGPDGTQPDVSAGIGLHHGPLVAGETGGDRQVQFTVTGDAVNVASRLQALTREHEVTILASDAVIDAARAIAGEEAVAGFRSLPMQEIRGRARPVGVWAWTG